MTGRGHAPNPQLSSLVGLTTTKDGWCLWRHSSTDPGNSHWTPQWLFRFLCPATRP